MCLNDFFPHDKFGFTLEVFTNPWEILPVMTFCMSVIASAFGISKFYLIGPLRLISQDSPLTGLLSLSFLAHIFINFGFVFRIYAIEHSLFSEYIISSCAPAFDKWGITTKSIPPVLPYEYRLVFYLMPILPSLIFNLLSLNQTLDTKSIFRLFLNFPQFIITPCFTPLIFNGVIHSDDDKRMNHFKVKIYRLASIINAIYIIFAPQIMLIISDVLRGVINWEFTSSANKWDEAMHEKDLETNSGLTKHRFGNIWFAEMICVISLVVLTFIFYKNRRMLSQESDVLGSKLIEEKQWKFSWVRNQIPKNETSNYEKVLRLLNEL